MEQVKKKGKAKKIILWTLCSILVVIVIAVSTVYGIFFNEVNALFTFKKVKDNVYYLEYNNNYYFDDFLEVGASSDSELIGFLTKKLLKGLPIKIELPDFGCSAFTATTSENDKLFSRNYDFDFSPILVTKTNPNNGYKSIATSDLKALGFTLENLPTSLIDKFMCLAAPYIPFDGINEKGVSICVNMVHGNPTEQNTNKISITTSTLIRLVLDKADSVEKAIELISNYDLNDSTGGPFHYQVADKSGDSAIIEYINNELKITRKTNDEKFLAMTNFLRHEDATPDDFGKDRYDIIYNKLTQTNGQLSELEAINLLKDAKMEWTDSDSVGGTMWSNVFNLSKLTMSFYSYQDFENKLTFSL